MIEPHTKVWIPYSQDGWHSGEVVATTPAGVKCIADDGEQEFVVPEDQLKLQNPTMLDGVDDMTTLSYLHEPAVLHNLATRCALSTIYTYTGTILIAINPYCKLSIYGREMIDAYCGQAVGKLQPHVYAVAESTYRDMLTNGTNQSILVSGESGAGKTETTKFLLSYFAAMAEKSKASPSSSSPSSPSVASALSPPLITYSPTSGRRSPVPSSPSSPSTLAPPKSPTPGSPLSGREKEQAAQNGEKASIEMQVLESTPILEAFGNAKTLRNDNSSRFGKWSEIQFDNAKGTIVGAKIRTYLLEKSRIVKPPEGERNYHIFYQLLAGTTPDEKKKFFLDKLPNSEEGVSHAFHYLQQSSCHTIPDVDDGEMFRITKRALASLGFNEEDGRCVWSVLAAALHLGNVTFEVGKNDEGKVMESSGYNPVVVVANLLAVDLETLKKVLTTRKMVAGTETYTIPMSPNQCSEARDSLAMLLYSRLFDWLVMRINQSISNPTEGLNFIGVLDIYGFEFFENNSFEQFTINYANEKLQQQFNQQIFKLEQLEYTKEKIDWSYIQFHDNQECVDLIEKKPIGILSLLDEETQFPKATAQTLATKLFNNLLGKSKHFEKPRFSNIQFTVDHYAGKVTYDTTSFLEKNKDFQVPEQLQMLEKSSLAFIKLLLPKQQQASGGAAKGKSSFQFLSVASQFRDSLASLMDSIHHTQPNYIRCIKPNSNKKPLTFDKVLVLQQLRCGGVLEQLRISRAGYPSRLLYANVMRRYKLLAVNQLPPTLWNNPKKCCEILMNTYKIGIEQVQFGLTKLFLRAGVVAQFETMRTQKLNNSAIAVQKHWKRFYYQRHYKQLRIATIYVQNCMRKSIARAILGRLREDYAATKLQCAVRKYAEVKKYRRIRQAAVVLQKAVLAFYAARKFAEMKLESAVTILQTAIRRAAALRWRSRLVYGVVKAQARWRAILAKRVYREMKIEARQLSTVIAEKNKLEKKAEELQWRLSAEAIVKQKLEEDNKKLAEKAAAAKEAAKAQEAEATTMAERLASLEAQVLLLQKQLEREKTEKSETEKKLDTDHGEVERLRKELAQEREEREREKEARERVAKELEEEREETKKLRVKVEELEAEIKARDERPKLSRQMSIVADFIPRKESAPPIPSITLEPLSPNAAISPNMRWQPGDGFTDEQIEAQNRNEPLKTALAIGGNEVDSGKFLIDMVIATRSEDGPSQFVSGIPEPSFVIFKFLLRRELVPCKVDIKILNYLIDSFASSLQVSNSDNDKLSFWMSNIAFLTYMVSKEIRIDPSHLVTFAADVIFHSTISQFHYGSPPLKRESSAESQPNMSNAFFNQLQTLLVKIFTCLFRNVTAKISPLLHEAMFKQNANIEKMDYITNYLTHILSSFQQNFVYLDLVRQFFEQIFFYMNCVIFNEILLRRDLNSLARGIDLKMKIAELESWAASSAKEWIGEATQQLKHAKQTITILMINKTVLENADMRQEICPDLTPAQVAQLLSLYTPDPDSFEEPIPIRVRQSILRSSSYHPDDRLLLDPAVLRPFPLSILHYLELAELDRIPYSSTILVTALMKMNISNKMPKVVTDDKVARVRSWSVKLKGSKG